MIIQNNLSVYFIKESNQNKSLQFWVGTQSEYDLIQNKKDNTYYIITDKEGGNFSGDSATDNEILITFYIGEDIEGVPYQAEEGMTWEEWVNSEYNTAGYYINNGKVIPGDSGGHVDLYFDGTNPVKANDVIINDSAYYIGLGWDDDL